MNRYKVAIVGCGSIGALKPDKYDSPKTHNILTHAHAVYNHAQADLVALVDADLEKSRDAAARWRKDGIIIHAYGATLGSIILPYDSKITISNMLRINKPDIIILATPTETHCSVLESMIVAVRCGHHKPKLVIAEKPFCSDYEQAEHIAQLYQREGIPILINYTRRFDPVHQEVNRWIQSGKLGEIRHCRVIYGRGLKREACHAIDLCNWWFGPCRQGSILDYLDTDPKDFLCDYSTADPSYTAQLKYENGTRVFLSPMDGRDYSIFEIDVLGSAGRITLTNHGLSCQHYPVMAEPVYGDYNTLDHVANNINDHSGMKQALLYALCNVVDHLETGKPLLCTPADALAAHKIYDMLRIKSIE
uniref:Putative oxidoreductase family protein n=1 Tax=viral metagenome TaxID=1070528 RepID=A0A6M3ILN8_9ZZZZ